MLGRLTIIRGSVKQIRKQSSKRIQNDKMINLMKKRDNMSPELSYASHPDTFSETELKPVRKFESAPEMSELNELSLKLAIKPFDRLKRGIVLKNAVFDEPIIFSTDRKLVGQFSRLYVQEKKNSNYGKNKEMHHVNNYQFENPIKKRIEFDEVDISESTKQHIKTMIPKTNMTMEEWKTDFQRTRDQATKELSEMLGRPIRPYPMTSLLEKMQKEYKFKTVKEYHDILSKLSFFKRGDMKTQIFEDWNKWIEDFGVEVTEYSKKLDTMHVDFGIDLPFENMVVLNLFEPTKNGLPKYFLSEQTFFSYKNCEELVELAGQLEASYEYGFGNKHRKHLKIKAIRNFVDFDKKSAWKSYHVDTDDLSAMDANSQAGYFTGVIICWYRTPEAAQRAIQLFHGTTLADFKELLSFETKIQSNAEYHKKKKYVQEQVWKNKMSCTSGIHHTKYMKDVFAMEGISKTQRGTKPIYPKGKENIIHDVLEDTMSRKFQKGGLETPGYVKTQVVEIGSSRNLMNNVEHAVVKVSSIIYDAFSRGMVSQSETDIEVFTIKENRSMVNKLSGKLMDVTEENMRELRAEAEFGESRKKE